MELSLDIFRNVFRGEHKIELVVGGKRLDELSRHGLYVVVGCLRQVKDRNTK